MSARRPRNPSAYERLSGEQSRPGQDKWKGSTEFIVLAGLVIAALIAIFVYGSDSKYTADRAQAILCTDYYNFVLLHGGNETYPFLHKVAHCPALEDAPSEWRMWIRQPDGHMYVPDSVTDLTRNTAPNMDFKCDLPMGDSALDGGNAQIAIDGDYAYFGTKSGGVIYKYNRRTCELVWQVVVAQVFEDHIPATGSDVKINASTSLITSRGTPILYKDSRDRETVIIAAPSERSACTANGVAYCTNLSSYIIKLHASNGAYMQHVKGTDNDIPSEFFSHYAGSPTLSHRTLYIGTSSFSNVFAGFGLTCTFIGQIQSFNAENLVMNWNRYMLPTDTGVGGFCGGSVWSRIAVDEDLGLVFFGTGQAHYHPLDVDTCLQAYVNPDDWGQALLDCHQYAVTNFSHPIAVDSIVAVQISTGEFEWVYSPIGMDTWVPSCPNYGPNTRSATPGIGCPGFTGPDWDFGGTTIIADLGFEKRILAANKGGIAYAVSALSGDLIWSINLGESSTFGGVQWGGSYDPNKQMAFFSSTGSQPELIVNQTLLGNYAHELPGDIWVCDTGTTHAIEVLSGNAIWQTYNPLGLVSTTGKAGLPTVSCQNADADLTQMIFKKSYAYLNTAGQPNNPLATATLGEPCDVADINGPVATSGPDYARFHGANMVTSDILTVGSLSGSVFLLDANNGDCIKSLDCAQGLVYGGATAVDNQLLVQCGYGAFFSSWIANGKGNVTRVFELV